MIKYRRVGLVVLAGIMLLFAAGCAGGQQHSEGNSQSRQQSPTQVHYKQTPDQTPAKKAVQQVKQHKQVTEVHAINSKKQLLVAVKLKTFASFSVKQITKKISKKLQKQNLRRKVQVSSDMKIYQQVTQAENQLRNGNISQRAFEKKVKKIVGFYKNQ